MRFQPDNFRGGDRERQEAPSERAAGREVEYLRHLATEQTPVAIHLRTGEVFRGFVEYYDRRFIRLTRQSEPNVFLFKQDIKYLCEE
ncbi:MAG: RNA chaperone Hfq [Acidobacteria bacterium]|nr:RNA chaperone Hfq [Acidobacteriota bacterium]